MKHQDIMLDITTRTVIVLPPDASFPLKHRAAEIARHMPMGTAGPVHATCGTPDSSHILIRCIRTEELPRQAYQLDGTKLPLILKAHDDAGFLYGLQTMQEMAIETPGKWQAAALEDAPALPRRGYMLDISRGKIPSMDTLKALAIALMRLRYNELQLYMEHTFAFEDDVDVWQGTDAMTAEQLQELDFHCREHFITLTPNFNCFGHLGRWFQISRYSHLAECEDGWYYAPWDCVMHSVLAPGKEATHFLESHLGELLPNFTAPECNIGFDETFELGHGKSAAACAEIGQGRLFARHLEAVCAILEKHGKKPLIWGDMAVTHPELLPILPKNLTAIVWKYEKEDDFASDTAVFKNANIPFMVAPGTSAWTSFCGRTDNMLENVDRAMAAAVNHGAKGILLTDWGDFNHLQHGIISWPAIAYAALQAWRPSPANRTALPNAMKRAFTPNAAIPAEFHALILELGRAANPFAHSPRGKTPFFLALLDDGHKLSKEFTHHATQAEFNAVRRRIARLSSAFHALGLPPDCPYALQFANTLQLISLALETLARRQRRRTGNATHPQRQLFSKALANFRELWLDRNRSGGLSDALALLARLQNA